MIKNPFLDRYNLIANKVSEFEKKETEAFANITWHDEFDIDEAFSKLNIDLREFGRLKLAAEKIELDVAEAIKIEKSLDQAVTLGWDPRYWFSSARSVKKSQLEELRKSLALLSSRRDEYKNSIKSMLERCNKQQADLDRYRAFNRLEAEATLIALRPHLINLRIELHKVRVKKEEVDEQLFEPLKELNNAYSLRTKLESAIRKAHDFDVGLKNASNSYERRIIHEECSSYFNESSPQRVVAAKNRELQGVIRTIDKLYARAKLIVDRAKRVVKALSVDGNNLCYQYQSFIGLSALQALVKKLAIDFPVVIVFDATIRRQLQMSDREIASQFPENVHVHIVASKQKADETLLDTARDQDTYVISNDRFKDFPDKSAVRDHRLIRHEIVADTIFVHDLNVAEYWT